ncbi:RHS repeat-associated core domain-containing protein [Streptomyces sp. NPDC008125]|uniref:RHS repeat domain-containing protein n=1 Tax=Streptomyces sp. NPDC008125 TaxID=3364811 RepID=UPI0036EE2EEF
MALSLITYLLVSLIGGPVAAATELTLQKLDTPDPVRSVTQKKHDVAKPDETAGAARRHTTKATWPKSGTGTAALPETGTNKAKAGTLPVSLGHARKSAKGAGPRKARVQILDQKASQAMGVTGVVVAVRPLEGKAGKTDVSLDYAGFQDAYGGDWASRLTLHQLPLCALTTPEKAGCRATGTNLNSTNDLDSTTLSASVTLPDAASTATADASPVTRSAATTSSATGLQAAQGIVLLSATAEAAGSSGDFKASPLSPSASWSAGGSSGAFTWSYDIPVPELPSQTEPELSLSYSSQAVDGRTAATNNQANWVGDGWSMEFGSIERRYVSCDDDTTNSNGTDKSADLCWKKDNAVLNLGGQSSELVKDDTTGEWHLEDDDGTKVVKLNDTSLANGDNDGEYWRVTTPDGTNYFFGRNKMSGWATGNAVTNSTWTVPVYGNQAGEPCHATAYADSWCQQAWRWNLDAVVDPHGDAIVQYWDKESNNYGRNVNQTTGASTATPYTRGGYAKRIEYGLRSNAYYAQPAAKVDFTVAERCLTDCGTFDSAHAKNWPDVPFDQYCADGAECKTQFSPSFWTRKRLTQVDTSVLVGSTYRKVDTLALTHQFPSTGDGSSPALWLASVTRTGHTGTGDVTMPPVTFSGQQLPNRVEGATTGTNPDPVPPLIRYRVYGINTETGGTIGVTYSAPDCKAGDVPTPASNTRRCYPVIWSPPDAPAANYTPYLDWFHTYVVTQVLESDNTGGAPAKETDYSYLDGMAWGKEEDEFTKAKYLTYSDRQGFGRVQVRTGAPASDAQTLTESRYFRGIDGAQVADHEGTTVADQPAFAGMPREEATFDGAAGALQSTTSYEPWRSAATATQVRTGLSALTAYATGTRVEKTRTAVGSGWRTTQTVRTFDAHGQETSESDLGDTSKTGDEECVTTTYTTGTILSLQKEVRNVAVACDKTPTLPADLISVARYYYDGATSLDTAPNKGDVTRVDEQDTAGTGYLTTATNTYDIHGRELTDTDAAGNTTTTAYTPTTVQAPTAQTETNALGHATTTEYDPARGVATGEVDPNGKRTDATYDGLGRTLRVWQPGWSKTDHPDQPSAEYAYSISKTANSSVSTKALQYDGTYATSYQLYDGLLRERETQASAIGTANRIVTETKYDSRGLAFKTYAAYYAEGAPSGVLTTAADNVVPSMVENLYDGTGRVTAAITRSYGDEKWRTTNVYAGDRTTVIPPKGGTAYTTVTDAQDRTIERIEYTNAARTASQSTRYTYGKWDEPSQVTDPAGNTWTYTFDARGQKVKSDDPDNGLAEITYDKVGRAETTTDARGVTLTNQYDKLGRQTALEKGSTQLASWLYDTVAKGQLTSSTRYIDGKPYTSSTTSYNDSYQPTATTVTVPTEAGALAGTYTWTYGYNTYTGQQEWIKHPAIGNLPSERQTTAYGEGNLPQKTTAGAVTLVNATAHDVFGRPTRTEYGTLGKKVYQTQVYDEVTGRVDRQTTDRDLAPQRIDDISYSFDDAGNITGITDVSGQDSTKSTDTQCFTNDALGRLTEAWTAATTTCSTTPSTTTVGGPDAYWQTFTYDAIGNRTKLVDHGTGALSGADATTTYTHKAAGTGLPHAVQSATVAGGALNGQKSSFAYDKSGNTTQRTIGTTTQNLTWDDEGNLATVTAGGKVTSYQYDADGNRMIARDADGTQTLTLPGDNELKIKADGTKEGTRYYTHGDETVAVRTSDGFSYLISDHQGTAMTAVSMTTQALTRRKQLPFGENRSTGSSTLPGTRSFVGGTADPTGLTHLGAREYDPALGRFISVDPIIDIDDPLQMNAYAYANSRPVTASDPDGQMFWDGFWTYANKAATAAKKLVHQTVKKAKKALASYSKKWNTFSRTAYFVKPTKSAAKTTKSATKKASTAVRKKSEPKKKDSFFGSLKKGNIGAAWNSAKSNTKKAVSAAGKWTWENRGNIVKGAAGLAFVACTVGTAGVCGVVGTGAFVLSVANRSVNYAQSDKSAGDLAAFGSGVALDTVGWRVNVVRSPGMFIKSYPLLASLATRAGQSRLLQQTSSLVWGTLGW